MNADGVPDFNALQNAIDSVAGDAIDYFVFDLPFHAGRDLRKLPALVAPALLSEIVDANPSDRIRLSQSFAGAGADARGGAADGLEGSC
jgi:bifunctional non-homologous end joining protein LigD